MAQKHDYVILELIEAAIRNVKAHPLNLGGIAGAGGGVGGPPGGFIGWLPQTRVAYDEDEDATLFTPISGASLLDNLNHIRYRLNIIESGASITVIDDDIPDTFYDTTAIHFSGAGVLVTDLGGGEVLVEINATGSGGGSPLIVEELDGSPSVNNVDKIIFSGATVTDLGDGDVLVSISSGTGRYRQYIYEENVPIEHSMGQSFNFEGVLDTCSGAGGAYIVPIFSGVIDKVIAYIRTPGTAGQTTIDVNLNGTTIFTDQGQRPLIIFNDPDQKVTTYPNISGIIEGDIITFDIDTIASGAAWLTVVPIITPYVSFGWVQSSGVPVTELMNLE